MAQISPSFWPRASSSAKIVRLSVRKKHRCFNLQVVSSVRPRNDSVAKFGCGEAHISTSKASKASLKSSCSRARAGDAACRDAVARLCCSCFEPPACLDRCAEGL